MKETIIKPEKKKVANLLRLARKADRVALGTTAVQNSLKANKIFILFSGKKDNRTVRRKRDELGKADVKVSYFFSEKELSYIFGRNKLTLVSVDDKNFAKGIKTELEKFKD
ncbi:MAG: 50S ribosomal protein L7ae [Candidatus Cloacimonetes bacterium]|nr:50S ribosomal protein L7ae [Candidatus Cloacimonadota bacterium]MBS3768135.1 50S ribosomal protein L7ae [Candidatus Cloacimonadota bacterium]